MSEKEEVYKTTGQAPIPRPIVPEPEPEPEPEPLPEIPEYNVSDFQEVESEPVVLTPEQQCERRVILRKLYSYAKTFPNELGQLRHAIADSVEIQDLDQLKMMLADVEHLVSSGQSITSSKNIFIAGVNVCEIMSRKTPLKLNGLTNVCRECSELDSIVQELSIKYQSEVVLTPEQRLALVMTGLISQIHHHNKQLEETVSTPVSEEKQKSREDLMEGL
jgi:hypothetical protein